MNGRMYDPIAGQFLSPDPFLQNPYLTQNFNRYSYCLNNPLKYVDPSGYERIRYERSKIPKPYIISFLNALAAGGLDFALANTPNTSGVFYYDDSNGNFEFWIDGGEGNPAASTTLTSLGYLITESAEIYSTKITLNLSSSQFQKFFGNNSGDLNYGLSFQSGAGGFGESPLLEIAGIAGYVSHGMIGTAAELTANSTYRYGTLAKSAVQMTREGSEIFGKLAFRFNVAGGTSGALVNTFKAADDYSKGNPKWGNFHASLGLNYAIGVGLLFVPGGQTAGGYLLFSTMFLDLGGEWINANNKRH